MNKILAHLKMLASEMPTKLTTYAAILVASAGELRGQWGELVELLPHWHWVRHIEAHAFALLGALMVYARLRRLFTGAK
jgi:hypothetical protein